MYKKSAFTLAEILIVVVVIGFIAALAIPSLLRGVTEKQWKAYYQKAYNTISNLYTAERTSGALPYTNTGNAVMTFFQTLNSYLAIKNYAAPSDEASIISESIFDESSFYSSITFDSNSTSDNSLIVQESTVSPWLITEDNMAYCIVAGKGCSTKQDILSSNGHNDAIQHACVIIVVDVNGLSNGPNRVEPQILSQNSLDSSKALDILTGDRFYIYVGNNGVTAGSKKSTVTGRIVSDLK